MAQTAKLYFLPFLFLMILLLSGCSENGNGNGDRGSIQEVRLTTPDQQQLFERQNDRLKFTSTATSENTITIDASQRFQEIDGFGYTLTGGSAYHIYRMSEEARKSLLTELFGTADNQIGVSYLRLSVGASDLDPAPFSYNDLPEGEEDLSLRDFSIDEDRKYLIPVLKEVLAIYPELKIMGSPWSPPAWMKDNNDTRGGKLKPEYYDVYARYLVKYVQEMAAEGVVIDALTVQNEPLHPGNNPSLLMLAEEQADFIKNHLGPTFKKAGIKTKIIVYDHNADRPDYPITILDDPLAKQYVDGSAFHLYGGEISALSKVHEAHPDKNLYFTEQWIGAPGNFSEDIKWHTRELIVGATRNWCRTVLEWNLAADPNQDPHTDRGGCDRCLGAVTIDGDEVVRNPAYYIIAHASKFVRPGSVRIESNMVEGLPNVAFLTPDNEIVLIVLNDSNTQKSFDISYNGKFASVNLDAGAVKTLVWDSTLNDRI